MLSHVRYHILLVCQLLASAWGGSLHAGQVSESLEALPPAAAFVDAFEAIAEQELVFYRTFTSRYGLLDLPGATRFLANALSRAATDRAIADALALLTPTTTVRPFLVTIGRTQAPPSATLGKLLTVPPKLFERSVEERVAWLRFQTRLRRQLVLRLASDPSPTARRALRRFAEATLASVASGDTVDLSVPWGLLPHRWHAATFSWRHPQGLPLLSAITDEAKRRNVSLAFFATLPASTLRPDGKWSDTLRQLEDLAQHAPDLIAGVQFGNALLDEEDEPLPEGLHRYVADHFLRLFAFSAQRQWRIRFDGFARAAHGRCYEPLAWAIAEYEGRPVNLVFNHALAIDGRWGELLQEHRPWSGASVVITVEQSPFFTELLTGAATTSVDAPNVWSSAAKASVVPSRRGATLWGSSPTTTEAPSCGELLFKASRHGRNDDESE